MEFRQFVRLVAIGLQARIPMHMTGFPGVGKTEFAKSLEAGFDRVGIRCKVVVLIGSIREPQDFGGFPVTTPDGVRLLPMAWAREAQRLAEDGYLVVVFLDELTTVPPTTQAAMLRLLTENVCGELRLPDYVPGKGGVAKFTSPEPTTMKLAPGVIFPTAHTLTLIERAEAGDQFVARKVFDGATVDNAGQVTAVIGPKLKPSPKPGDALGEANTSYKDGITGLSWQVATLLQ